MREPLPQRQAAGEVVLEVKEISKSFIAPKAAGRAKSVVLQDISFDVRAAEVVGIVGESGSGKSEPVPRSCSGCFTRMTVR